MRILFIITSLASGGAERILSFISSSLSERGHSVSVLTLKNTDFDFYSLGPGVVRLPCVDFSKGGNLRNKFIRHLKNVKAISVASDSYEPDLIVSFMDFPSFYALVATNFFSRKKVPVCVALRNDMRAQVVHPLWKIFRRLLFPLADVFVVQTNSLSDYIKRRFKKPVFTISNPLTDNFRAGSSYKSESKVILCVARLVPQKGLEILLKAFALSAAKESGWRVAIVGEGEQRKALEYLSRSLQIDDRLSMPGRQKDVAIHYSRAAIFVLPSFHEGFPNVLIEAMSHGLPVIASDCMSGPAEIIEDGVSGFLFGVCDYKELASHIDRLVAYPSLRKLVGANARQSVAKYHPDKIIKQWEEALVDVAKK